MSKNKSILYNLGTFFVFRLFLLHYMRFHVSIREHMCFFFNNQFFVLYNPFIGDMYLHIVFPLISVPGAYLISKLQDAALIVGWHFKEEGACFKARGITHMKFQNFLFFSFQITIDDYHYNV